MKIEIKKVRESSLVTGTSEEAGGELIGTMDSDTVVRYLPYDGELIKIHNDTGGVETWVVTHVLHHYQWNFPPGSVEGVESQLVVSSVEIRVVPALLTQRGSSIGA